MPSWLRHSVAWLGGLLLVALRATCRFEIIGHDPRPDLRSRGIPYAYAILHAHQLAACFGHGEREAAAMVSRSTDGDLLVPLLRMRHVRAIRGSTRKKNRDKGGAEALTALAALVRQRIPAVIAVDGPRGPRNHVHRGVVSIAHQAQGMVLPAIAIPNRRWILPKTWDRLQIPKPFSRIRLVLAEPIPVPNESEIPLVRERTAAELQRLEQIHDADEARNCVNLPRKAA